MSEQEDYTRAGGMAAHKTTHQDGGSDEISVEALSGVLTEPQHVLTAEVKAVKLDDFAAPDDNTDLNASSTKHGLLKKLSNIASQFLNGAGGWTTPPDTTYPSAHKAAHQNGGADQVDVSDLSGVLADPQHIIVAEAKAIKLDDFTAPDDNTDLNASTSRHGFLRKLSGVVTEFLNGQGGWSVPPGGGGLRVNDISGFVLSPDLNPLHDVNITAGVARDSTDSHDIILPSEITKHIDHGWVVGDDDGGMDTGAVGNNLHYAVWLIKRSDTGVVDVLFSLSFTAPTMPTDYDFKRLIGWVLTDSSANIRAFRAYGTGNVVEYWFDIRQQIATGLNGTSLTAQDVSSVFPTSVMTVLGIYYGLFSSGDNTAAGLGYDSSNVAACILSSVNLNNSNQVYAVGRDSNQPFFLPPNGNNVYYIVASNSITLSGLSARIQR